MFRQYCVILCVLVESILLSYTSMSVQLSVVLPTSALTNLCKLARYFLRGPWGWCNSAGTCRSSTYNNLSINLHWL